MWTVGCHTHVECVRAILLLEAAGDPSAVRAEIERDSAAQLLNVADAEVVHRLFLFFRATRADAWGATLQAASLPRCVTPAM